MSYCSALSNSGCNIKFLNRSLSEVRGASENATIAALANTNIRGDIQAAEDLALTAIQNATDVLNQVSQAKQIERLIYLQGLFRCLFWREKDVPQGKRWILVFVVDSVRGANEWTGDTGPAA